MTISYSQRGPMRPLCPRVRAYFAPVNRATSAPSVFDPAKNGQFPLASPPGPWIDAGWISNFKRTSQTKIQPVRSGSKGIAQQQFRQAFDAGVQFDMHEWGKLQMAISSGSQHINLLQEDVSSAPTPSGGLTDSPTATFPGSTASEIAVGVGNVNAFNLGDMIAVDNDYAAQTGYVGTGIAGAFIKNAADVGLDPNYLRRITFNVGRVNGKTTSTLLLAQPLLGGTPAPTMQVQKVVGFVDREGGSFFQEWSALFACISETGARVFYHYPRLQSASASQESSAEIAGSFDAWSLHAKLIAMPTTDTLDHEQVLCYRSFVPALNAALY